MSIGEEDAQAIYQTQWWKGKQAAEIVEKQIKYRELICPYLLYYNAVWDLLGKPPTPRDIRHPQYNRRIMRKVREIRKRRKAQSHGPTRAERSRHHHLAHGA